MSGAAAGPIFQRPGAKPAPKPAPASAPVQGYKSTAEVIAWFQARHQYPIVNLGEKAPLACVVPILVEYDRLAQRYPEAAAKVFYIRCVPGSSWPRDAYAEATPAAITFNPYWLYNAASLKAHLASNEREGYHPKGCGDLEYLLDHEFGHFLGRWLGDPKVPACSKYAQTDKFEAFAEAFASMVRGNTGPAATRVRDLIAAKRAAH